MNRSLLSFLSRFKKEKAKPISRQLRDKLIKEDGNYYTGQGNDYAYQYVFSPRDMEMEEFRIISYRDKIWTVGRWVEDDCGDYSFLAYIHNNVPLKGLRR